MLLAPTEKPCHAAAARILEASNDILALVFASLSLVERLRLVTVSKRWLRLLLADLRFPREHVWRAPVVVKRAGSALRSLTLAGVGELFTRNCAIRELVRALSGCPGSQLSSVVTLEPTAVGDDNYWENGPALSAEQAMQLVASCPHLDRRTRLCLRAEAGAAQAVAMLDALPGSHAVSW